MSGKVVYITDTEGNLDYFKKCIELSGEGISLSPDDKEIVLEDGWTFVVRARAEAAVRADVRPRRAGARAGRGVWSRASRPGSGRARAVPPAPRALVRAGQASGARARRSRAVGGALAPWRAGRRSGGDELHVACGAALPRARSSARVLLRAPAPQRAALCPRAVAARPPRAARRSARRPAASLEATRATRARARSALRPSSSPPSGATAPASCSSWATATSTSCASAPS
jgi:hypothetical protein